MPDPGPSTKHIRRKLLRIKDDKTANIIQHFDEATNWIDKALADTVKINGKKVQSRVLVDRVRGVSRSATIVIAYLMKYEIPEFKNQKYIFNPRKEMLQMSALALAKSMVKSARPIVNPNSGFIEQLTLWQDCKFDIHERGKDGKFVREKKANVEFKEKLEEAKKPVKDAKKLSELMKNMSIGGAGKMSAAVTFVSVRLGDRMDEFRRQRRDAPSLYTQADVRTFPLSRSNLRSRSSRKVQTYLGISYSPSCPSHRPSPGLLLLTADRRYLSQQATQPANIDPSPQSSPSRISMADMEMSDEYMRGFEPVPRERPDVEIEKYLQIDEVVPGLYITGYVAPILVAIGR
jgi:hypothetical protein